MKRRAECSVDRRDSAFNEFLERCRLATTNDTAVLELIEKTYRRTDPNFLSSQDFSKLINLSSERIVLDPSNKFVHIKHFVSELKANKAELKANKVAPAKRPLHHHNRLSSTDDEPVIKRTKSDVKTAIVSDVKSSTAVITSSSSSAANTNCSLSAGAVPSASSSSAAVDSSSAAGLIIESDTVECNTESIEILVSDEEEETAVTTVRHPVPSTILCNPACSQKLEVNVSEAVSVERVNSVPISSLQPSLSADENNAAGESTKKFKASSTTSPGFQKQIRRLEKLLVALDKQIRTLQERELTLDDMEEDDSTYLLEDRLHDVSTQTAGSTFVSPRGWTPEDVAQYFIQHAGRRPSSLAALLTDPGAQPDPATVFWLQTMAALQRSLASTVLEEVRDQMAVDPTGTKAFQRGIQVLTRFSSRPCDLE